MGSYHKKTRKSPLSALILFFFGSIFSVLIFYYIFFILGYLKGFANKIELKNKKDYISQGITIGPTMLLLPKGSNLMIKYDVDIEKGEFFTFFNAYEPLEKEKNNADLKCGGPLYSSRICKRINKSGKGILSYYADSTGFFLFDFGGVPDKKNYEYDLTYNLEWYIIRN